jgi:cobalt-zinc-cadmium efflux system outer membrane protein
MIVRRIMIHCTLGWLLPCALAVAQSPDTRLAEAQRTDSARLRIIQRISPSPRGEEVAPTIEPPAGLTLADLEGIALANNPTLVQAGARVEAARGDWVQAGLRPNPNVGYAATQIGDNGGAGQQGAYVEQLFPLGGKLKLSRAVASQEVKQALWRRDAQQWAVLNDVRIAYYEVLIAQRTVDLARRLLEIGEQGERAAADLLKAEQVSRVDYLQARIEARTARIELNNDLNRLDAAWRSLAAVLGTPWLAPCEILGDVSTDLPEFSWEASLARVLTASPELAAARAGVARARWAVDRARAEPIPDLDAQYSPQHDNTTGDNIHNLQATLNFPLFDRNQGNIRAAQADLVYASREVSRIELDLQQRLAAAFERYANARQQVDLYTRDILPDAQTTLDLVANGYRQGEFGYLALLTAQRTLFQTNLAYLSALGDLRRSAVEIEGYLITGSLDRARGGEQSPRATAGSRTSRAGPVRVGE